MNKKDFSQSAFEDLDKLCRIGPGDVIVVGGRTGMGKSAFLQDMAIKWASQGKEITYWDMQVSSDERINRILSSHSEVEMEKIISWCEYKNSGFKDNFKLKTNDIEHQRIISALNEIQQWQIKFPQDVNIYEWLEHGEMPDVLVIDSIQMLMFSKEMAVEIHVLMNLLKKKALETEMLVLISSQLSREVDFRPGKRPILTDLSDSSSLEEVADKVLFLLRREYYDPLDKPGEAEIIVAKNNNGRTGFFNLVFKKELSKFCNYIPFVSNDISEEAFSAFTPE